MLKLRPFIILAFSVSFFLNTVNPPLEARPAPQRLAFPFEEEPEESEEKPEAAFLPRRSHAGPVIHSLEYPSSALVDHYLELYSAEIHHPWLRLIQRRSLFYMDKIRRTIEYWDVPWEIAFLPVVESAFLPQVVSTSGAAGIWQFMTNSIGPYNMRIDEWRDDRRDFWKATEGAIQKLKYNYEVLGDWYLALAAYNCGLGRVQRTVAQYGINDFWELSQKELLPRQTIHYVPRLMALSHILSYSGRWKWNPAPSWDRPVKWTVISLKQPVDLRILAAESGVPLEILSQGNTELKHMITPPPAGSPPEHYQLKVPEEYSDSIREALAKGEQNLIRFYLYTIKAGDTFYALSRHYGVSVAMLEKYNPGVKATALNPGARIVIPAVKEVEPYRGRPEEPAETLTRDYQGLYEVAPGDTLWGISRRFGISLQELAYNNGLAGDEILRPGTRLKVPETE